MDYITVQRVLRYELRDRGYRPTFKNHLDGFSLCETGMYMLVNHKYKKSENILTTTEGVQKGYNMILHYTLSTREWPRVLH